MEAGHPPGRGRARCASQAAGHSAAATGTESSPQTPQRNTKHWSTAETTHAATASSPLSNNHKHIRV